MDIVALRVRCIELAIAILAEKATPDAVLELAGRLTAFAKGS